MRRALQFYRIRGWDAYLACTLYLGDRPLNKSVFYPCQTSLVNLPQRVGLLTICWLGQKIQILNGSARSDGAPCDGITTHPVGQIRIQIGSVLAVRDSLKGIV